MLSLDTCMKCSWFSSRSESQIRADVFSSDWVQVDVCVCIGGHITSSFELFKIYGFSAKLVFPNPSTLDPIWEPQGHMTICHLWFLPYTVTVSLALEVGEVWGGVFVIHVHTPSLFPMYVSLVVSYISRRLSTAVISYPRKTCGY